MRISNESLQSTATSLGADAELPALYLGHVCNFSIQLVFTGSPVGSFKLQCSNDPGPQSGVSPVPVVQTVVNWTDIAGSAQAVSAAGDLTWQVADAGFNWVRVVYTRTSGTGSLTSARSNTKGV